MKKEICILVLFLVFNTIVHAEEIPDIKQLSNFYQAMGKMYSDLKKITDDFLNHKITASIYNEKITKWTVAYNRNDPLAPCPKNNWQSHYSELSPLHYVLCFAWADLQGFQTSLAISDSKMVLYHEKEFRKGMNEAFTIFKNPKLNRVKE